MKHSYSEENCGVWSVESDAPYEILLELQVTEQAISVFLSYSRKDKDLLDKLITHLAGLRRTGKITTWHDRDIEAGSEWEPELQRQLDTADIILLLISADFMASDYCYGKELQRAIERHDRKEARVIPVILRPCDWNIPEIPFSKLNALPDNAEPIVSSKWQYPDEALTIVARGVREVSDQLKSARSIDKVQQVIELPDRTLNTLNTPHPSPLPEGEREQETSLDAPAPLLPTWEKGLGDEGLSMPSLESLPRLELIADRTSPENDRVQGATQQQPEIFVEKLDDRTILEMVKIPGGSFLMGSSPGQGFDDERPQHKVQVPEFWMGKYPVTQAQWRFVASLPQEKRELIAKPAKFTGDNRPVERVSWHQAIEFCLRLSRQTDNDYRLPTEAEWEYACRAGTLTDFYFGDTLTPELANFGRNVGETTDVGIYKPNAFGLYDMHGNIWEWCTDDWHNNYEKAPIDGSAWTDSSSGIRVLRGGSWDFNPRDCRSAARDFNNPVDRGYNFGFRVVSRARTL